MFLMLGNSKVLYFNFPDFTVEIIREELLPYSLRCNIQKTHTMKSILSNVQEVKNYLSSRMLSLSRDHAKKIYAAFQIPQVDTIDNRVDICIRCKGVSIQDSYWVQDDDDTDKWEDINILRRLQPYRYDKPNLPGADDKRAFSKRLDSHGRHAVSAQIRQDKGFCKYQNGDSGIKNYGVL